MHRPMKSVSIIISVFVAIASITVFRAHLIDLASDTVDFVLNKHSSLSTSAATAPPPEAPDTSIPTFKEQEEYHISATNMSVSRAVRKVILAIEQSEGAGARVRRSIGTPQLRNFSPFLMLDHFSIKPGAGFPDQ
jgi:quercetin 2,3-dioxygenase